VPIWLVMITGLEGLSSWYHDEASPLNEKLTYGIFYGLLNIIVLSTCDYMAGENNSKPMGRLHSPPVKRLPLWLGRMIRKELDAASIRTMYATFKKKGGRGLLLAMVAEILIYNIIACLNRFKAKRSTPITRGAVIIGV